MAKVQMLAIDDVEFLEKHEATMCFRGGHKIGLEWRRPDGLLLQHSGWTVGHAINSAREALRRWRETDAQGLADEKGGHRPCAALASHDSETHDCVWCMAEGQKLERQNIVRFLREWGDEPAADQIEEAAHLESKPTD